MTAPHFLPARRSAGVRIADGLDAVLDAAARLSTLLDRLGDRVHAEGDEFAASEGWQITKMRLGGRTYRHPGFVAGIAPGQLAAAQARQNAGQGAGS